MTYERRASVNRKLFSCFKANRRNAKDKTFISDMRILREETFPYFLMAFETLRRLKKIRFSVSMCYLL